MWSATISCFGTIVALFVAVLLFVFVVIPTIGIIFTFVGRLIRFVFQELRDVILIPIALFVGVIKLLRATLCVILARWDIARVEMTAAKQRFSEARERIISVFIDNPLRVVGINTTKESSDTEYIQGVVSEVKGVTQELKDVFRGAHGSESKFEGYKIIGTLPSGGSGAKIYIAKPLDNTPEVVIKCFEISDGSRLPQIVRESRGVEAAKKLGLIIEHHLDNKRFWYAMPYHKGDNLGVVTTSLHGSSSNLDSEKLHTVCQYQQTLLQTLQEYHVAGLWHKDVKPDNIIIHDGKAHLVDLGLVTPLASAMTLTTHGTEYFRDPELVRQAVRGVKVHQVDGSKFDVYSAGAVLYFMLENTFPPHGGLSSFHKKSPEGIRWIVRRAMSDYDKRYASVEEMLRDVEVVLAAKNIASVRPIDLPSMKSKPQTESSRRLTAKTTPSTGGGPFSNNRNKTKPMGIIALLAAIVIGATIVYSTTPQKNLISPQSVRDPATQSILRAAIPTGRILVLDDCAMASDPDGCRGQVEFTINKLTKSGWDVFYDIQIDARARMWIPENLTVTTEVASKIEHEQLGGVLVFQEGESNTIVATLINSSSSTKYIVDVE